MHTIVNLWPLLGILTITMGFILRLNPALSIFLTILVTCISGHKGIIDILNLVGNGFLKTRNLTLLVLLPLTVVGLMEKYGLREQTKILISRLSKVTISKLLIVYLAFRQFTAAIGLNMLGGHPQMVRPLLVPMVEGIAANKYGQINFNTQNLLKAYCAAADNIGLFFGEDIFVAFGAIALITTFLQQYGIIVLPIHVALWGIPTAICAFITHAYRIYLLDKKLQHMLNCSTKD